MGTENLSAARIWWRRGGWHRRTAIVAVTAVAALGAIVMGARQEGFSAQAVDLGSGSVWVTSNGPGQMALLDGASAEVTVKLRVANDGDDVLAVQGQGAGYAVNRTNGTVLRVDAATWTTSPAQVMIDGSTSGLTAIASELAFFATDVDHGLVVSADPRTLQPAGSPRSLSARPGPGSPILDSTGVLWLLDAVKGNLIGMSDDPETVQEAITDGPHGRLVAVQDKPVVVDLAAGLAIPIEASSGAADDPVCVDVNRDDSTVRVLGSNSRNELYTVSGASGVLRITDLATGTCTGAIPDIATPADDLGQPVESARRVFVPNYTTGEVVIVDLDNRKTITTPPLIEPGGTFELLGRDGFVFYNDRASNQAGVIDTDGTLRSVAKFDSTDPAKGIFEPKEAEPSTKVDQQSAGGTDPATAASTPFESETGAPTALNVPPSQEARSSVAIGPDPPTLTGISTPRIAPSRTASVRPTPTVSDAPPSSTNSTNSTTATTATVSTTDMTAAPVPIVESIDIQSKRGEPYLSGDTLTLSATISGGTPTGWAWTLTDISHKGNPTVVSTNPSFSLNANSGGQSTEWEVSLIAVNATGASLAKPRRFTVDHTNNNPVTITDVHGAPNPGLVGQNIALSVTFTGAPFACEVVVFDEMNVESGRASCLNVNALPFNEPGRYRMQVTVSPREGDDVTDEAFFTIFENADLTINFAGTGTGVVTDELARRCTNPCSPLHNELGDVKTLTATGDKGATAQWSDCDTASGQSCTITMNGPKTVSVTFTADTSPPDVTLIAGGLTATPTAGGTSTLAIPSSSPTISFSAQSSDPQGAVTNTSIRYFVDEITCIDPDSDIGSTKQLLGNGVGTELIGADDTLAADSVDISNLASCPASRPRKYFSVAFWATATSGGGTTKTQMIHAEFSP